MTTTERPTGATDRGGAVSTIKPDDLVWCRKRVKTVKETPDGDPIVTLAGVSGCDVASRMLPDSPALPAVAEWMARFPDLVDDLMAALTIQAVESDRAASLWAEFCAKKSESGYEHKAGQHTRKADGFRSLVAALDGDARGEGD